MKTFREMWLDSLKSFKCYEITEAELTRRLTLCSPLYCEEYPVTNEDFEAFAFRVERMTHEKFTSARVRGMLLRKLEAEGKICCDVCGGKPVSLEVSPPGSYSRLLRRA